MDQDFFHSVIPLLKLISLTLFGLILARPKTQLIPKPTFKLLSKLTFVLFLPCLIFINLGKTITLHNFLQWWFIPFNVILSTILGLLLGFLVTKLCKPPQEFTRLTIILTAFGNTGNLPLAIVGSVCHGKHGNPFGPDCQTAGTAYVSFGQWVAVLLVYTVVYHMMEPPLEYYEVVDGDVDSIRVASYAGGNDLSRPLLVEAEWPGMEGKETEHCKTALVARVFSNLEEIVETNGELEEGSSSRGGDRDPESPKSLRCLAEPAMMKKIRIVAEKTPISHILQPPTLATVLALVIGMAPPVKSVVYGSEAPLAFITDSLAILSEAMVPSVMLVLGGMLAEGPNESRLGLRTTIGVMVARLVMLPVIGMGVVWAADGVGLLVAGDRMYKFVLLLQYTMPSAILLGAVGSLRGYGEREAAAVIFWQHAFAVLSLALYIMVYFRMLSGNDSR